MSHRHVELTSLPYYYHVHLHMPCNQRCIMCVPSGKHPNTSLPFDEFAAILGQIQSHAEHITLIGGEPFLYPHIGRVLGLLAERSIAVSINTNATMICDSMSEKLLKLHELHLKCSIDAASRELYRRIRGTDYFDRVVDNINRFASKSSVQSNIKVILVYVVMRENLQEVLPFIALFKDAPLERIEFHPVRHVSNWVVENKTGWVFHGEKQICETFPKEYEEVMCQARELGESYGLEIEVQPVP